MFPLALSKWINRRNREDTPQGESKRNKALGVRVGQWWELTQEGGARPEP